MSVAEVVIRFENQVVPRVEWTPRHSPACSFTVLFVFQSYRLVGIQPVAETGNCMLANRTLGESLVIQSLCVVSDCAADAQQYSLVFWHLTSCPTR